MDVRKIRKVRRLKNGAQILSAGKLQVSQVFEGGEKASVGEVSRSHSWRCYAAQVDFTVTGIINTFPKARHEVRLGNYGEFRAALRYCQAKLRGDRSGITLKSILDISQGFVSHLGDQNDTS